MGDVIDALRAASACERDLEAVHEAVVAQLQMLSHFEVEFRKLTDLNAEQERRILDLQRMCDEHGAQIHFMVSGRGGAGRQGRQSESYNENARPQELGSASGRVAAS